MDTWIWIVIAVVVVLVVMAALAMAMSKRRTAALRQHFGTEYDHTVVAAGGRRDAERELREREERRAEFEIRPLSDAARERYQNDWNELQARFVDRPQVAVADADELLTRLMREVGYPLENFESNAALVSVDHPDVVDRYREGHNIYTKTVEGTATTEDLRQAVVAYRALFDELMRDSAEAER
jgi:hypothetical protein